MKENGKNSFEELQCPFWKQGGAENGFSKWHGRGKELCHWDDWEGRAGTQLGHWAPSSRQGEWDGGGKALFKHHLLSTSREEAYRESASAEEDKRGDLNSQSTSSHQAFAARGAAQCAVHRVNPSWTAPTVWAQLAWKQPWGTPFLEMAMKTKDCCSSAKITTGYNQVC